jgi:D-alanine-D-alanine ligase
MNKKTILVLMGGMSSEHEVSIASGTKVAESLDREKFDVVPVVIGLDGLWRFDGSQPLDIFDAVPEIKNRNPDCALIALHGAFGEDGRLQGMLDLLDIPYTSSGCAASAIAMDKLRCKALVRDAGIRVGDEITVRRADWEKDPASVLDSIKLCFGFPCVIKAPCQGSSVGMAIPKSMDELRAAIPGIFAFDSRLMVEEYVTGAEVTCAILDVDVSGPVALPVTEIRPLSASFFDYTAKYTPGASREITPAEIDPELAAEIQKSAVEVHRVVGCSIWSRSDFILGPDGPVWLEVNTVPGLTPMSLFPQAAAAKGISYAALMEMFIEAAIRNGQIKEGR